MLLPSDVLSNVTGHPWWSILTILLAKDKFAAKTICARLDGLEKLHDRLCVFVAACHLKHCQLKARLTENRRHFSELVEK